jgi:hypothetical protein
MSHGDMIPITDNEGLTTWVTRPPERCPNGHPFRPGDGARTYAEGWYACGCAGAEDDNDGRPGHNTYRCKRCDAVTLLPECTDPSLKVGWAAAHGG